MKPFERSIVWLRRDYRLSDHRALFEACARSNEVVPVFVIDEVLLKGFKNVRQVQFIQDCLDDLEERLRERGSRLLVVRGNPAHKIPELAKTLKARAVFLNHDYEPLAKIRDAHVERELGKMGVEFHSFKDQVIFERREILSGGGSPYKVFTPYSRAWLKAFESNRAQHLKEYRPDLKKLVAADAIGERNARFSELGFARVDLGGVKGSEREAQALLKRFSKSIAGYKTDRDFPAIEGTSRLSVHFRFGTISARQAVGFCAEHLSEGSKTWLSELIWREFYMMILDQFPHVEKGAFKPEYDNLGWEWNRDHFRAWCEGRTGFPIVDAAIRQLNATGFMHNRLRMIVAMFLTKDLLIDWREGEKYFAEQLLDHELSANNGGWQWSASTGCDAQPYFRVMNPVSQSERFDPKGDFIREWVPELKHLDSKRIHWPHEEGGLFASGNKGYADPLVDHKEQRLKAIRMFKKDQPKPMQ
jgi:deoxyribodipyrimidine photo-lyase